LQFAGRDGVTGEIEEVAQEVGRRGTGDMNIKYNKTSRKNRTGVKIMHTLRVLYGVLVQ